ncbi:MAG TPA: SGNH/GDSL hydrolase family protein [Planctomycetota bacterium]|nr:SGNH/GDSL hydrolase family protein [Planctomycetota bacterium]
MGAPHPPPRTRRRVYVRALTLLRLLLAGEAIARLLVPEAALSPYQPVYRPDPVAGYTLQPGFRGHAFGTRLEANSLGFRGPEWSRAKPPGTVRIALIGDSHAFAFGVPFEHSVGEVLARRLESATGRRHEVLNFALPGFNSAQQLAVLRAHALAYAPDLVLVLPCSNDHERPLWADEEGWLHWAPADELPAETTRVDGDPFIPPPRLALLAHCRLYMYAKLVWTRHRRARAIAAQTAATREEPWLPPLPASAATPSHLVPAVEEPLVAMADECRARAIPIVFALFSAPTGYRLLARNLAERTGAPVLELLALFPEVTSWHDLLVRFGLGWDSHLNAEAHERWAHALAELITERGLLR